MLKKGLFIISLDFELMWGVRDKKSIESYGTNIKGVREVIPALLHLFDTYDVEATFATVGFLFARNKKELFDFVPHILPQYKFSNYSPYANNYLQMIGDAEKDDIYHYGETLITEIQKFPKNEIASHTFSHYYCLEGASSESFKADLIAAKEIAKLYNVELKSIVFPRNQYSSEHIEICKQMGFTSYRGNQISTVYNPRSNKELSKKIRAIRLADSYVNITGHHAFNIEKNDTIINIPASRFLRPYSNILKMPDGLRLIRIKKSMSFAAKNNYAFHLWWHPHNFGVHLKENINFLEEILKHYQYLNKNYGMESRTMKRISEEILSSHAV
jgi:peptidoglycan/xylan/chitin deacetylase (PgdA/CDA1 family)